MANAVATEIGEEFNISPDYVRVSVAAAMALGLRPGQFFRGATCDCVNLLETYPAGCYAHRTYRRVGRVCVAMVQDKRAYPDLLDIVGRISRRSDVPVSALVTATLLDAEKLARIRDAGADIVGIGLDAASEEVFFRTRGRGARGPHSWTHHSPIARAARRSFR